MGVSKIYFTTFGPENKLASGQNFHVFGQKKRFWGVAYFGPLPQGPPWLDPKNFAPNKICDFN